MYDTGDRSGARRRSCVADDYVTIAPLGFVAVAVTFDGRVETGGVGA